MHTLCYNIDILLLDDDVDVDVDMDDGLVPQKEEVSRRQDILERAQKWTLDNDILDVANERLLDWIWSVVGQLRLKSVIANDMLLAKDGNLQGPTSSFDLASAMKQRLVVGNILTQVRDIINKQSAHHSI